MPDKIVRIYPASVVVRILKAEHQGGAVFHACPRVLAAVRRSDPYCRNV